METAIVLFTRDLRLHDNPALCQACSRARQVVPVSAGLARRGMAPASPIRTSAPAGR
jgi:deoxyribodipyrimidine photolyase